MNPRLWPLTHALFPQYVELERVVHVMQNSVAVLSWHLQQLCKLQIKLAIPMRKRDSQLVQAHPSDVLEEWLLVHSTPYETNSQMTH